NGTQIGGNTPNLQVTQAGTYGLTYTIISTGCEVTTDYIDIEYFNPIITPDPVDLFKCNSGQTRVTFDMSFNTEVVTILGTQITYHSTLADANSNINSLPINYTLAAASLPATVWMRISNTLTNCAITKSFQLKLTPPPVANNPGDMRLCETIPQSNVADFNVSFQTATVLGTQSPAIYDVSYHIKPSDASSGTDPIDPSVIYSTGNTTLFVRVQNRTDTSCFNTTSFNLVVIPRPTIDLIPDQFVCIGFTLPVLVNPGNYYSGPNKGLPMLSAGDIITADSNIFIYYETAGTPTCSNDMSFNVKIVEPIDIRPADVLACDQYILPTLGFGARYFTLPDGPSGGGTELFAGTAITNPGTNLIYTYFVSTDVVPCELQTKFDIIINLTPIIAAIPNAFDCVSYNLPPLTVGNYYTFDSATGNYTPASSPITTTTTLYVFATNNNNCRTPDTVFTVYIDNLGLVNVTQCQPYNLLPAPVGEYRDAPNGGGNIIPPGLISQTRNVYIFVPGAGTPNCTNNDFFTITITAPFLSTPAKVTECASYVLPVQADGGKYYTLSGGPAIAGNIELIPNVDTVTTTTTVYIYKASWTVAGCFNEIPWLITINQKPTIDSRADIEQCSSYVLSPLANGNYFDDPNGVNPLADGTTINKNDRIYIYAAHPNDPFCYSENFFDISINGVEADPVPTQLSYCESFTFPALPTANNFYYDAPGGSLGGGNRIPFGTRVTAANALSTYYIYYETGDRLNCSDENPFSITIVPRPVANPVNPLETCDTFASNDGVFEFDLTTPAIRTQVLNGQTPNVDFTLTFFTTLAGANNTSAIPIANPAAYQNDNPFTDSVWIRISNSTITNPCFAVAELRLIVNPLPNIQLNPEYFICEDYETGTLLNPAILNTGLTTSNYIFEWTYDGNTFGGNTSSITTTQIGDYSVKVTNTNTNCINTFASKVFKYAPYIEITYSDAFVNPSFISANVLGVGSGNYEYQIDDSLFQDSNIFENVSPGEHTISVRDKDGHCNPAPINAVLINYPKYFTPNGDGYNETWNIPHLLSTNPDAPIFIFDRYGKLIQKITPSTDGWNGMFNGQPLPSTDYWFTVDYSEKGTSKIFKSHFTLKR
ncbi:MAG TPA: T9SS type B sorting domain-containing protein, partial [Flavobacterium sp.]|nr:T9SS type B sorting domain-containing protein [Flavobacterium sp.]